MEGCITANGVTDIYYIARKYLNQNDLRNTLRSLFKIFDIIDVFGADCRKALDFPLEDYEDALLSVCSDRAAIDYIITRDEEFLHQAKTKVIAPAGFLKLIDTEY